MAFRKFVFLVFLLPFLAFVGCSSGPQMAPVKGKVMLDGKPISQGSIRFEATGVRPATGKIVNGEIVEVTTFTDNDGVPVGSHKVAVSAFEDAASAVVANPGQSKGTGANYMVGKSLVRDIYTDPSTSGLTAEIKPGANVVEFKLVSDASKDKK